MEIGFDLLCRVHWAHVDEIWIFSQLGPFWLDDSLEVFRVSGEYVLMYAHCDSIVSLARFYFYYLAA